MTFGRNPYTTAGFSSDSKRTPYFKYFEARDVEQAIAICQIMFEANVGGFCLVMRGHVSAVKAQCKIDTVAEFVEYTKVMALLYEDRAKMDDTPHMQKWHRESAAALREYLTWAGK